MRRRVVKMDLGVGDVHRDGFMKPARWAKCARCSSPQGWDMSEARNCLACGQSFFETPQPDAAPGDRRPGDPRPRLPTGQPEPGGSEDPGTWVSTRARTMRRKTSTVTEMISAKKRKSLAGSQFALPAQKKYPIDTAARVRNAAARLEQNKGSLSPADYSKAKGAIARAAKRFGIKSEYNARDEVRPDNGALPSAGKPRGQAPATSPAPVKPVPGDPYPMRVTVATHPSGHRRIDIFQARDDGPEGCPDVGGEYAELGRKLSDARARLLTIPTGDAGRAEVEAEAVKLADELRVPKWNQVARVGSFKGHPSGPFELTPQVFDEIVRNFEQVDGQQVPIDFEHASEADESAGSIPQQGAPAAGWITRLQNRGLEGLYGLCTFLDPALEYVREGRYRSFSPAIRFGSKHPETGAPIGARLTSVALVTRPFLRGLQPLAARDAAAAPGETPMSEPTTPAAVKLDDAHPTEKMRHFKMCMKLGDLATPDEMKDHLDKLREHAKPILDKPHGHAVGHVSAGGVKMDDYVQPLAAAINAPAHMSVAEVFDAVEHMIDAAMERHEAEYHMNDGDLLNDPIKLGQRLGETSEKIARLEGENKTLLRDRDGAVLTLRQAEGKITALEKQVAERDLELKTLRDAETARKDASDNARVETAFATYKDLHKLSDAHKGMMLRELRADAANFDRLYPPVSPTQEHLLRDLTTSRSPGGGAPPVTAPGPTAPMPGAGDSKLSTLDQVKLADRLVSQFKMSRERATSYAYEVAVGSKPMPNLGS